MRTVCGSPLVSDTLSLLRGPADLLDSLGEWPLPRTRLQPPPPDCKLRSCFLCIPSPQAAAAMLASLLLGLSWLAWPLLPFQACLYPALSQQALPESSAFADSPLNFCGPLGTTSQTWAHVLQLGGRERGWAVSPLQAHQEPRQGSEVASQVRGFGD